MLSLRSRSSISCARSFPPSSSSCTPPLTNHALWYFNRSRTTDNQAAGNQMQDEDNIYTCNQAKQNSMQHKLQIHAHAQVSKQINQKICDKGPRSNARWNKQNKLLSNPAKEKGLEWTDCSNQVVIACRSSCGGRSSKRAVWSHAPPSSGTSERCSVPAYGVYGSTGRPSCHSNQMSTNFM